METGTGNCIVAAFIAGARLTKIQLLIVNTGFVITAGIVDYLVVAIFDRFFSFAVRANVPAGSASPVDFTIPLGILVTTIFAGCLVFMWSVRRGAR